MSIHIRYAIGTWKNRYGTGGNSPRDNVDVRGVPARIQQKVRGSGSSSGGGGSASGYRPGLDGKPEIAEHLCSSQSTTIKWYEENGRKKWKLEPDHVDTRCPICLLCSIHCLGHQQLMEGVKRQLLHSKYSDLRTPIAPMEQRNILTRKIAVQLAQGVQVRKQNAA